MSSVRTAGALFLVAMIGLCTGSTAMRAQVPTVPKAPATQPFSGILHLNVVVTSASGEPVTGLTAKDFTVLDHKTPRQPLTVAAMTGTQQPSTVIIVFDAVNTPLIALGYQRNQVKKFLLANDGQLAQPTTFAVLTDKSLDVFNTVTRDGNILAAGVDHMETGLREINRSQGFYGADDREQISLSALQEIEATESRRPGDKLLVWLSPGWPLLSGPGIDLDARQQDAIFRTAVDVDTRLREDGITLYSLDSWGADENLNREFYYKSFTDGLKNPGGAQLGNLGLQVFAQESGGLVLNSSGVVQMLQQCYADAAYHYELTMQAPPAEHANEYHSLRIQVDRPNAQVRSPTGYYDQPVTP
jgi:VWFA-related protein